MIFIYGVELYGKLPVREGQYIATRFFHVFFLPLLPLGSMLLDREPGQAHMTRVDLPLHGLSVITAYMRTWAPVVGLLLLPTSLLASALLLCLYILSWGEYGVTVEEQPPAAEPSAGGDERKSRPVKLPRARADKSERERQRVEALFQKLRPQHQEPSEEEQAQARAQPPSAPPGRGTG